jgi:hypothetical protein
VTSVYFRQVVFASSSRQGAKVVAFHLRKYPKAEHHTELRQQPAVSGSPAIQAFEVRRKS